MSCSLRGAPQFARGTCRLRINVRIAGILTYVLFAVFASQLKADYLWPLPFGKELTSIFGDWRIRHYHAGLDIRTGSQIGKPVLAPADGYVMRLSTSYYGYGKALYFKMKDGNVAVYGHLDHFDKAIAAYVAKKQIESESFNQNLTVPENQFRYKRSEVICFSGQTGIGAPHLHFEIRTPDNKPVNPLMFDGLKVADNQLPVFRRLKIVGIGNEELAEALGRKLYYTFTRDPKTGAYRLSDTLECFGDDFSIAVDVIDKVGVSGWEKPIYSLELKQGDRSLYKLTYDTLDYDSTYLIDRDRNYQMAMKGEKEYFNVLVCDSIQSHCGLCSVVKDSVIVLNLFAKDMAGNESQARFFIRKMMPGQMPPFKPNYQKLNAMIDYTGAKYDDLITAFISDGDRLQLLFKYALPGKVRLWAYPSRRDIEDAAYFTDLGNSFYLVGVDAAQGKDYTSDAPILEITASFEKGTERHYEVKVDYRRPWFIQGNLLGHIVSDDGNVKVLFPSLQDGFFPTDKHFFVRLATGKSGDVKNYEITPNDMPLAKPATFSYKFEGKIPPHAALYFVNGAALTFIGNDIDTADNALTANAYHLGTISMRIDSIHPVISNVSPFLNAQILRSRPTIKCKIRDNMSGIRDSIEVRIDGKWCIPEYDPESGWVSSTPHFDLSAGKHNFEIKVTDRVGNTGQYQSGFTVSRPKNR